MDMEEDIREALYISGYTCAYYYDENRRIEYIIHHSLGQEDKPTYIYRRIPECYYKSDIAVAAFVGCETSKEFKFIKLHEVTPDFMQYALNMCYIINTHLIFLIITPYQSKNMIANMLFSNVFVEDFNDEAALEYIFG
jgi:hypothetical protein